MGMSWNNFGALIAAQKCGLRAEAMADMLLAPLPSLLPGSQ